METDKSALIEEYLQRIGSPLTVTYADGRTAQSYAVIGGAWTRRRQHFEEKAALPGRYSDIYFYYIGPPSLDVTALTREDTLTAYGRQFYFTRNEAVSVGGKVQYYRGLLRETEEDDDVFGNGN